LKKNIQPQSVDLRQKAENLLKKKVSQSPSQFSEADVLKLIHELEVHQIELEMINDELRFSKEKEAELATSKYIELYDFAPIGYCTLSKEGRIIEINLRGASLLSKERSLLINGRFGFFVSENSRPIFNRFLDKVFNSKGKEACELTLTIAEQLVVHVLLNGIAAANGERCLITIVDITDRKLEEVERKQSQEKLRAFAAMLQENREQERKSIAREIHDEFGQVLTAIKMNLTILGNETTKRIESSEAVSINSEIDNMKLIIDQTIHKVRVFTNKLRLDVLDTFGLFEALEVYINEFGELYSIKCTYIKPEDEIRIDMDRSIAVYRIVQEALTNVVKHAKATRVWIKIDEKDNHLFVSVEDNGAGMDEKQLGNAKKFGITGMKERAYICGGSLTVSSPKKKGTVLELSIPLKEND
jgi:signal transduction histidine kinase